MRLLGFIPLSLLGPEANVGNSLFVSFGSAAAAAAARQQQLKQQLQQQLQQQRQQQQQEQKQQQQQTNVETRNALSYFEESKRLLSALILAMDKKQVAAVVSFVPRRGAPVMLGALLPQVNSTKSTTGGPP
ncbi:hypothetical protein ETH_00042975 [Eimeria tenella]|uniref:Ku domain-containing protein n=1 Tax=Eimeria tenella TaxID=5802 RepID=U6KLZ1_EIMTE|nr:hypothetical protein ETH_00042975 [Eimeria tenella]CDJ39127.1 hypothetical protein ETH_00042975 [Eimeria tenella]|eukprot:XP_013229882.1 hypothetical protein ETH_00042975 [Eimeria tenella]